MLKVAEELPDQGAIVSLMDLSLEAHAFGCSISVSDYEVPSVSQRIINNKEEASQLEVPSLDKGRCQCYIDAIKLVVQEELNRPLFAGVIGPFSLAGRLMDVSEIMVQCFMDKEYATIVLRKATKFLKEYIRAYKEAGANGVLMAEPLAGLLSPELLDEFSSVYVKEIVEELQDDYFSIIYHNCGPSTVQSVPEIMKCGCAAYHFGNAINLHEILEQADKDCLIMGNVDPVRYFLKGTTDDMAQAVQDLLSRCASYPNFIASSGCDIPPLAKWDNIHQFYESIKQYNRKEG